MTMHISHSGVGTGRGITYSLVSGMTVAPGQQRNFLHYNKFVKRTAVQGQCDLSTAGSHAIGIAVDCSPQGDSITVETSGFEWVKVADASDFAIKDLVTVGASGMAVACADAAVVTPYDAGPPIVPEVLGPRPILAELIAGVWEVEQIDLVNNMVLIDLDGDL